MKKNRKQLQLFYFTGQCLALDDHPGTIGFIRRGFTSGEILPEDFIQFCDSHLILPAIYLKINKYNLADLFPEKLLTWMNELYRQNKQRNLKILEQTEEINRVLQSVNIEPLYLKGTAHLMDNLYSDPGERLIGDIDVLVRNDEYLNAVEKLVKVGYHTIKPVYCDVSRSTHYPPLFKNNRPVRVEVHRLPVASTFARWFTTNDVIRHKKAIRGRVNCFVQSNEHQLIHNFIHSRLTNLGHGFYVWSLRDLYDFYLLAKQTDPGAVRKLAKEHKKLDCCYAMACRAFGYNAQLSEKASKYTAQYIRRFEWYALRPRLHHLRILAVKLNELATRRFFPSLSALITGNFWCRTFRNLTKTGFYRMLIFRGRHFIARYIRRP